MVWRLPSALKTLSLNVPECVPSKGSFNLLSFPSNHMGLKILCPETVWVLFFCVSTCINTKFLRPGRFSYSSFVFRSFLLVKSTRKSRFFFCASRNSRAAAAIRAGFLALVPDLQDLFAPGPCQIDLGPWGLGALGCQIRPLF